VGDERSKTGAEKRSLRRRRALCAAAFLAGLLLAAPLLLNACVATIHPPENPRLPCEVFLLENARHVGIVLPDGSGGLVEFGFGEFKWYARMEDAWYRVFPALLWPTRGCLGRRQVRPAGSGPFPGGRLTPMTVGEAEARILYESLERRFEEGLDTLVYNGAYGLEFVEDPESFWLFRNCHDATAEWFERLGCRISWVPVRLGTSVAKKE